jgi:hypothetical protein
VPNPARRVPALGLVTDAAFGQFGTVPPTLQPKGFTTRILSAIERGEPQAAERLLPLVYDELR